MYRPVQIPYLLSSHFKENMSYSEAVINELKNFVICFWEIYSYPEANAIVDNIIVPDGCIDLIIDYQAQQIVFSGMSKTEFHFELQAPAYFWGVRFKPGAFWQLTSRSATEAMDETLPLQCIDPDFDLDYFFSLTAESGKEIIKEYLLKLVNQQTPSSYLSLFDQLYESTTLLSANDLYKQLNFSPRQCQRLFLKHYGISPKMILSVIRFQQCLTILTSEKAKQSDIIGVTGYYDQSHYIKDIKKNLGITPLELINLFH